MDSYKTFVKEIAERNPIHGTHDEMNVCDFCHTGWAEDDYATYRKNETYRRANPSDRTATWDHHSPDCLWVIANELMERNSED